MKKYFFLIGEKLGMKEIHKVLFLNIIHLTFISVIMYINKTNSSYVKKKSQRKLFLRDVDFIFYMH